MRIAVSGNGKKRQLPTGRILTTDVTTPKQSKSERDAYLGVNLFPGTDGLLRQFGETQLIMGWDENLEIGQKWDGDTLRDDYYVQFAHPGQALFLVKKGLDEADYGSRAFWDGLELFLTRDCFYVLEKPRIGLYRFDPHRVIPISTKNNDREYPVTGLRHCRLLTVQEAKFVLRKFMRDY